MPGQNKGSPANIVICRYDDGDLHSFPSPRLRNQLVGVQPRFDVQYTPIGWQPTNMGRDGQTDAGRWRPFQTKRQAVYGWAQEPKVGQLEISRAPRLAKCGVMNCASCTEKHGHRAADRA